MPPSCLSCSKIVSNNQGLCENCWEELTFLGKPCCAQCGFPFDTNLSKNKDTENGLCGPCISRQPKFDKARSIVTYDDISRDLILKFKHGDRLEVAPLFGHWLTLQYKEITSHTDVDFIVPIPLHPKRLLFRRFNQAALIAKHLSKNVGKPFHPRLLKRIKNTESQGHLSASARKRNIRNAFQIDRLPKSAVTGTLEGTCVLLIDDVYTTGSTVEEAANCLKRAGARTVFVLTIARVIRPSEPL